VAQQRIVAESQDRGHPVAAARDVWMAHGVGPWMDPVQPSGGQSVPNRSTTKTEFHELSPGDHSVLLRCNLSDR
jgi:hypothetical protein